MLGLTVGAVLVYLALLFSRPSRLPALLSGSALTLALSIIPCFLAHLRLPFQPAGSLTYMFVNGHLWLALTARLVVALPEI